MDTSLKKSFFKWKLTAVLIMPLILAAIYYFSTTHNSFFSLPQPRFVHIFDRQLPENLKLTSITGEPIEYDLLDQWTLVSFWAEWCQPCVAEIPAMLEFQSSLGDRNVEFVWVNMDGSEDRQKAQEYWFSLGGGSDDFVYDKDRSLQELLEVEGLPFHALIAPNARLYWSRLGQLDWLHPDTRANLIKVLEQEPAQGQEASF